MRLTISGRSVHRHEVFLVHLFDLVLSFVSRFSSDVVIAMQSSLSIMVLFSHCDDVLALLVTLACAQITIIARM
jgi:hypothetical protein